jgi:hypothetical protein
LQYIFFLPKSRVTLSAVPVSAAANPTFGQTKKPLAPRAEFAQAVSGFIDYSGSSSNALACLQMNQPNILIFRENINRLSRRYFQSPERAKASTAARSNESSSKGARGDSAGAIGLRGEEIARTHLVRSPATHGGHFHAR